MSSLPAQPGDLIAGKYRIDSVLGQGGMGVVFAATHTDLGSRVALKFLLPSVAKDGMRVARFFREARAAASIQSEHVARVLDVARADDGTPFLVMEYLDGSDFSSVLRERGSLPIERAVDLVLQICEALAEAHNLGIVHRDLKPANLFLAKRADGSSLAKVLDFGIAKAIDPASSDAVTKTSAVLGSPLYMSPEQVRSSKVVDARSDLWSLGVVLHELLTGRPAFESTSVTELMAMIAADPPTALRARLPDAPVALEQVILRCLEKDVARRTPTIAALAEGLSPFASPRGRMSVERIVGTIAAGAVTQTSLAPPESLPAHKSASQLTTSPWAKTTAAGTPRGTVKVMVGLGALVLVGAAAVALWRSPPAARPGGHEATIAPSASAPSAESIAAPATAAPSAPVAVSAAPSVSVPKLPPGPIVARPSVSRSSTPAPTATGTEDPLKAATESRKLGNRGVTVSRAASCLCFLAACARPAPTPIASVAPVTSAPPVTPVPTPTASASLPSPAPAIAGDLTIAFVLPAWDTVLAGDNVIVIDPDFHGVSAHDLTTGERRWHTPISEAGGGRHTLSLRGPSLHYWAGDLLHRIEASTGKIVSTEQVPTNGECSVQESGGVCAFGCSCSLRLASCDSGKAIGPRYDKTRIEMFGHGAEPPHAGCFGTGVGLVAGGRGIGVLEIEDRSKPGVSRFGASHIIIGADASSGRELWRSQSLLRSGTGGESGEISGRGFRSSSDGDLDVFDLRTGKVLWQRAGLPGLGRVPRHVLQVDREHGLLFRLLEGDATLFSADGRTIWRASVPKEAWALLRGAPTSAYSIRADDQMTTALFVLDETTGAVRGTISMRPKSYLFPDPAGGYYVLGDGLSAHDAEGKERARLAVVDPPNLQPGTDFAALFSGESLAFRERTDLAPVGALSGSFSVREGSSLARGLLVYRFVEKGTKPGEAMVVRRTR